jgi:hypothetical protein
MPEKFCRPTVRFDADGIPHVMVGDKELSVRAVTIRWSISDACRLAIDTFVFTEPDGIVAGFGRVGMDGTKE